MNKCCPKCGTETSAGQKFCAKCGQALESGAYDDAVESGEPVVFSQNASSNSEKSIKEKVSDLLKSTNKRIIFAAAAVLIIGLILFFAFHTFTPSNNRIKADLTDYIDDVRTGTFSIKKLAVDDKEFYDNKQYLDIICAVTLESDCVRRYESYELSYMKRESGGWKVVDISECDYNYWSSEPISGVTEQYIIDKLYGLTVSVNESNVALDKNNLKSVTIEEQSTDLEAGTDEVKVVYCLESDIASCEQEAEISFLFAQNDWQLTNIQNVGSSEISYTEGHEFERSESEIKSDLYTTPITWESNYGTQNISVDEKSLKNFESKGQNFEWSGGQVTVSCSFTLEKRVATLHVDADVIYTNAASGWIVSAINYTPVVQSISLKGDWVGYYTSSSGKPSLTLSVTSHDANNMLAATFSFGSSANAPDYAHGSFSMVGGVEKDTLIVNLKANSWIDQPSGIEGLYMPDLQGMLWIDDEKIADKNHSSYAFEVTLKNSDEG